MVGSAKKGGSGNCGDGERVEGLLVFKLFFLQNFVLFEKEILIC